MYKSKYSGAVIDSGISLLETTENGKTGLRLLRSNPLNHGNIGNWAIDLSTQTSASSFNGATGSFSFSAGFNTISNNEYMASFGSFNKGLLNTIFEIGVGTSTEKKNALEIHKDGRILAPALEPALIIDNKSLVTKEYLEANGGGAGGGAGTGLERLVDAVDTNRQSYRLVGKGPAGYGRPGYNAVDFSLGGEGDGYSFGSIGNYSISIGFNQMNASSYSLSSGLNNITFGSGGLNLGMYNQLIRGEKAIISQVNGNLILIHQLCL